MKVQKKLHIQITDRLTERSVDLVQYDTGIQLVFYFADFQIPDGTTATLYVQKPSGKFVYQETGIVVSGNTVTVDLENQAVAEYGTVGAQLQLVNGEDTVSTAACTLRVAQSLKDAGAEGSKTVIAAFDVKTAEQIALIKESAQQQIALVEAASVAEQEAIANEGLRVLNTIPADYTATAALAEQAVREKAGAIICKATGEFITLTDASDDYVRGLKLFGKTMQRKTTGKNLLNIAESFTFTRYTEYKNLYIPKGKYIISCGNTTTQGTAQPTAGLFSSDGSRFAIVHLSPNTTQEIDANLDIAKIVLYSNGFDNAASTDITATVNQFMISAEGGAYEPYTGGAPSPSPDYPQALESVGDGGSVAVTVAGKNLFFGPSPATKNGVTLSKVDDYYVLNGTATASGHFYTDKNFLPHGIYTLSANNPTIGTGASSRTLVQVCSISTGGDLQTAQNAINGKSTAELPAADDYQFRISYRTGITYDNVIIKPQLEVGTVATEYEPPKSLRSLTASTVHEDGRPNGLPGIPVSIGGNYTDKNGQKWICDEIDFERGVYVQRVGAVVYTGTESGWGYDTSGKNPCFYRTLHALKLMPYAFSSHFAFAMAPYAKPNGTTGLFGWESTYSVLYIASELTTVDAWKAYLAEQNANGTPVTVKYLLREPVETPISEDELAAYRALHTNYPNTTVYNDGGAGMEIRYNADTKTYIDNKFAELAQALVNNL